MIEQKIAGKAVGLCHTTPAISSQAAEIKENFSQLSGY